MKHPPEFCSHCGSRLSPAGEGGPRICNGCGACHHCGPALLVLVLVFARERLLLQRPESLEVGWFSYDELTELDIWEPGVSLDMRVLFEGIRLNRRDFYQQNEHFSRLLGESNS